MSRSRAHPLFILLLVSFLPLMAQQEEDIDWIYEIDLLGRELAQKHPDLFFKMDSVEFINELNQIARGASGQSLFNLSVKLQQVLARVGDAHTQINYHYNIDKGFILPISCYWFEEGIFITKAPAIYEKILGKKIAFINNFPIEQVIDSLATLVVDENPSPIKNQVPRMITWTQLLEHFGFTDHTNLELGVTDLGSKIENCRITLPLEEGEMLDIQPDSLPLGFRNPKAYFWDQYFEDVNLYYIQYNRCWSREVEEEYGSGASALFMPSFKEFEKKSIQFLKKQKIDKLVFDMRFNAGGNSQQGTRFIRKICDMKLKGKGDIFVVVGRSTFASAIINTVDFIKNSQAIIVGEETGGRPNHFGEVKRFVLPESKLVVNYSSKYFTLLDEDLPTIIPSIRTPVTFKQYMQGIDPALESILHLED